MEQHPVPRNITGFQFHLIGDMTLKQFGELLAGSIFGYITIKLPLPTFVTWPVGAFFALAGVAFAFVPVQERPLDRWLVVFLKSIYSPTQFLWQKTNEPPAILTQTITKKTPTEQKKQLPQMQESRQKLAAYLATLPQHPQQTIDKYEIDKLKQTMALFAHMTPLTTSQTKTQARPSTHGLKAPSTIPSAYPTMPHEEKEGPKLGKPAPTYEDLLQQTNTLVKKQDSMSSLPVPPPPQVEKTAVDEKIQAVVTELSDARISPQHYEELQEQLAALAQEKERLANELVRLKRSLVGQESKPPGEIAAVQASPGVKIIKPEDAIKFGLPSIPQVPNMVSGIIKDRQDNLLANIIITVKDASDTPQRALKSNRLGQFAISTPLASGTYKIEIEDPQKKYVFDTITLTLTGELTTPIELLAKSQRELERERLMKEVFGKTS